MNEASIATSPAVRLEGKYLRVARMVLDWWLYRPAIKTARAASISRQREDAITEVRYLADLLDRLGWSKVVEVTADDIETLRRAAFMQLRSYAANVYNGADNQIAGIAEWGERHDLKQMMEAVRLLDRLGWSA